MKATDLVLESQSSILFKGPFGHAKTCAAATFAKDGPIWISYWDKKKPVELFHFFHKIIKQPRLLDNIEYEVYNSSNANKYLNKMIDFADDCRYFAIINDSVTNMTSGAVNWSLGFSGKKKDQDKDKIMPSFDEYKVETSLVTQALDICKSLPCHVIWTCHPVPSIKIEGSGTTMKITKSEPIVTYGNKVAGIVPGNFSEIYHFSRTSTWDSILGKNLLRFKVNTEAVGDDFAKSNLGLTGEFDITNKLFYEVWKEQVLKLREELKNAVAAEQTKPINPFDTTNPSIQPTTKQWKT